MEAVPGTAGQRPPLRGSNPLKVDMPTRMIFRFEVKTMMKVFGGTLIIDVKQKSC